ncbi:MAG: type II toxin-antitoxin system VapC family toxin [Phycisphaerae bacterium]|nr:type II toxin-antitoxin system VapC family toxin [Phycisphaerae bacterium]
MSAVLLDTHVLLWWLAEPERLAPRTQELLADRSRRILVSAATAWEIAIKQTLGRLDCPGNLREAIGEQGFEALAVSIEHALEVASLPLHHSDPFDRLLVAQARIEQASLVTADPRLAYYRINLIPA